LIAGKSPSATMLKGFSASIPQFRHSPGVAPSSKSCRLGQGILDAPVNTLGIRRIMFAVDDIDAVVACMRAHGAELIGEMQYEDTYRLAYIRGPEGIIVALAEQLG
jgi:predicted enzyme related to lactoylglutathione lyase